MRTILFTSYLFLFTFSASAQSVIRTLAWELDTARPAAITWPLVRGETVDLECRYLSGASAMDVRGAAVVLHARTNGMPADLSFQVTGSVGRVTSTNLASVGWATVRVRPDLDLPHDVKSCSFTLETTLGDARNLVAQGVLRLSGDPTGATPAAIPVFAYDAKGSAQAVSNALAGALQAVDLNLAARITSVSGSVDSVSAGLTSVSGSVASVSAGLTSVSGSVDSVSAGLTSVSGAVVSVASSVSNLSTSVAIIDSLARTNRVTMWPDPSDPMSWWVETDSTTRTKFTRVEADPYYVVTLSPDFLHTGLGTRPAWTNHVFPFQDGYWSGFTVDAFSDSASVYYDMGELSAEWFESGIGGVLPVTLNPISAHSQGTATISVGPVSYVTNQVPYSLTTGNVWSAVSAAQASLDNVIATKELHVDSFTNVIWRSVFSNGWHRLVAVTNTP